MLHAITILHPFKCAFRVGKMIHLEEHEPLSHAVEWRGTPWTGCQFIAREKHLRYTLNSTYTQFGITNSPKIPEHQENTCSQEVKWNLHTEGPWLEVEPETLLQWGDSTNQAKCPSSNQNEVKKKKKSGDVIVLIPLSKLSSSVSIACATKGVVPLWGFRSIKQALVTALCLHSTNVDR